MISGVQAETISICRELNVSDTIYILDTNVIADTTCMNVTAENVTLDCQNYIIGYANAGEQPDGLGVYSNQNFTTVKNCLIEQIEVGGNAKHGIHFDDAYNGTIYNNTITTKELSCFGIILETSHNNNISNNNITLNQPPGSTSAGIFVWSSSNNSFSDNLIIAERDDYYGLELFGDSTNNSFSGMDIRTNSSGAYPLYIYDGNHNFTISDSILNSSDSIAEFYINSLVTGGVWNLTNITRSDGSNINITWENYANGTINVFWYLDVNVTNSTGPLENANVACWDTNNNLKFSENTSATGLITAQTLQEYWQNRTDTTYYTNFTLNTTASDYKGDSREVNLTINMQEDITLTADITAPTVTISSPTATTYNTTSIVLNVSADETISTWQYSLNGASNSTFTPNTTIIAVVGSNSLIVYAIDAAGNIGSDSVSFTVEIDLVTIIGEWFYINHFNDSSTEKSLTFSSNITHVSIPKNASVAYFANASMQITGHRLGNEHINDFNFSVASEDTVPYGVTSNGTYIWVSGLDNDKIFVYNMDGTYTGTSWDYNCTGTNGYGIDTDNTYIFVSCFTKTVIDQFYMNGTFVKPIDVSPEQPRGVTTNGTSLFIYDDVDKFAEYNYTGYKIRTISWSGYSVQSVVEGLEYNGTNFWIADDNNWVLFNDSGAFVRYFINFSGVGPSDMQYDNERSLWGLRSGSHDMVMRFVDPWPRDITIDTGNEGTIDYNFSGILNQTTSPQYVDLNAAAIKQFLSSCTADSNGLCDLPLNITSETHGIIELSNLNLTYTFNSFLPCGTISNTTALNFSTFREENSTVPVRSDWEAEFILAHADFDFTQTLTFDPTNSTNLTVCIYPEDAEYVVNATLKYTNNPSEAVNYSTRYYFMQRSVINNATNDIFLYLLDIDLSNQISFIIKNIYNIPQSDIVVKATRFFISEGVYRQIDMGLSDFDGIATMQLKLNEWYIIIIEKDGVIIRTFPQKFIINTDDIETFTSIGTQVEYFGYFDSVGASCNPDPATLLLTCIFSDTSGKMVNLNLTIERRQLVGGFVGVCTNSTTASSGTVSCSYSGYNDTELHYSLTGTFCCSQTTFWTLLMGNIVPSASVLFGLTGVVIMIFIVITLVMFGYWHPVVPIVGGVFAILIGVTLQLIVIPSIALGSLAVAGGIIIYKMKS